VSDAPDAHPDWHLRVTDHDGVTLVYRGTDLLDVDLDEGRYTVRVLDEEAGMVKAIVKGKLP
jgi:hypothetical protein